MRPKRPPEEEILTWCGIISQLVRTRANKILHDDNLPYPLFVLLRHFCHDPAREWTVSSLTAAFETSQSGMTKQVQRLIELGYLQSRNDTQDARIKWLRTTPAGEAMRDMLMTRLMPDQQSLFSNWSTHDVQQLHAGLYRLKTYLDENRDAFIQSD
jgi:DNA-binding MarR family transcriptional regulator